VYARGGAAGGQLALADQGSGGGRAAGPARQARGGKREGKRGGGARGEGLLHGLLACKGGMPGCSA
jgi:hypothetical protein